MRYARKVGLTTKSHAATKVATSVVGVAAGELPRTTHDQDPLSSDGWLIALLEAIGRGPSSAIMRPASASRYTKWQGPCCKTSVWWGPALTGKLLSSVSCKSSQSEAAFAVKVGYSKTLHKMGNMALMAAPQLAAHSALAEK